MKHICPAGHASLFRSCSICAAALHPLKSKAERNRAIRESAARARRVRLTQIEITTKGRYVTSKARAA